MRESGDVPIRRRLQDFATGASRLELAIAFVSAALTGGLLNVLQQILSTGDIESGVLVLGYALIGGLALALVLWAVARRYSLDVGLCFVIRPEELRNRAGVIASLQGASRAWFPIEVVDNEASWLARASSELSRMTLGVTTTLSSSVGEPRVLLAISASDAVGFVVGHTVRPLLFGADVQLLTLPTDSQAWPPQRYTAGESTHRAFFARSDVAQTTCQCAVPRGAGVVHAWRSPGHNPDIVVRGLIDQGLICCRGAVVRIAAGAEPVPMTQREAIDSARFLRSRARTLMAARPLDPVDIALTCGPEVSTLAGLVLSGLCHWRVWEFDNGADRWESRWVSA